MNEYITVVKQGDTPDEKGNYRTQKSILRKNWERLKETGTYGYVEKDAFEASLDAKDLAIADLQRQLAEARAVEAKQAAQEDMAEENPFGPEEEGYAAMSRAELADLYKEEFGKSAGNMKKNEIIEALENGE